MGWRLLSPMTWAWFRQGRQAGRSWWDLLHGYVYARWPYGYIGSAIGERRELIPLRALFAPFLARGLGRRGPQRWAAEYHGKVVPTETATRLIDVREPIDVVLPEQVIPHAGARELVLAAGGPIALLDCPCRLARENPCLPLDVCLIVGDPFASFVLEHHPERARRIDADEALAVLDAEAERGHVHHAFFKEAMLGRFYAICNCCSCCCGAMQAQRNGTPMLISSGYVAQVDVTACIGCGTCAERCPFDAMTVRDGHAFVDTGACMGCGVCVHGCPQGALSLRREGARPAPLEIPSPSCAVDSSSEELAAAAMHSGAFDWLATEPDLYSDDDLVERFQRRA